MAKSGHLEDFMPKKDPSQMFLPKARLRRRKKYVRRNDEEKKC